MGGWQVPAYPMPDDMTDLGVHRIVVRLGLSRDLAGLLLDAIKEEVDFLENLDAPIPRERPRTNFAH